MRHPLPAAIAAATWTSCPLPSGTYHGIADRFGAKAFGFLGDKDEFANCIDAQLWIVAGASIQLRRIVDIVEWTPDGDATTAMVSLAPIHGAMRDTPDPDEGSHLEMVRRIASRDTATCGARIGKVTSIRECPHRSLFIRQRKAAPLAVAKSALAGRSGRVVDLTRAAIKLAELCLATVEIKDRCHKRHIINPIRTHWGAIA